MVLPPHAAVILSLSAPGREVITSRALRPSQIPALMPLSAFIFVWSDRACYALGCCSGYSSNRSLWLSGFKGGRACDERDPGLSDPPGIPCYFRLSGCEPVRTTRVLHHLHADADVRPGGLEEHPRRHPR